MYDLPNEYHYTVLSIIQVVLFKTILVEISLELKDSIGEEKKEKKEKENRKYISEENLLKAFDLILILI